MRFVTGLDWSGNAGDPAKNPGLSSLVFAAVSIRDDELDLVRTNLATVRRSLRVADTYVFKHADSSDRALGAFFQALAKSPATIHVYSIFKPEWPRSYLDRTTGPDRISDGIVELVCRLPDEFVDDQFLLIDLPRGELTTIRNLRVVLRKALRGSGRRTFKDVRPCQDHRDETSMIQIADMVAGEFGKQGGSSGPHLHLITSKLVVL